MKNYKFKLENIVISICLLCLISCQEENLNTFALKETNFDFNNFKKFSNEKLLDYTKNASYTRAELSWMDWATIGVADAVGTYEGAKICVPLVPPWGSIAGGLIVGASSSYITYRGLQSGICSSTTSPNNNVLNSDNPYDNVGIYHNRFQNYFVTNNILVDSSITLYNEFLNNAINLSDNNLSEEFILEVLPFDIFVQSASLSVIFDGDSKNENELKIFMSNFPLDEESTNILLEYFLDIQQIANLSSATEYSKDIEYYIQNSELNENKIKYILCAMATFRHSINYWYDGTVN